VPTRLGPGFESASAAADFEIPKRIGGSKTGIWFGLAVVVIAAAGVGIWLRASSESHTPQAPSARSALASARREAPSDALGRTHGLGGPSRFHCTSQRAVRHGRTAAAVSATERAPAGRTPSLSRARNDRESPETSACSARRCDPPEGGPQAEAGRHHDRSRRTLLKVLYICAASG
jgi:hypothetical protein